MPKFTITTETGRRSETSDEPLEFPHAKAAAHDAQVALSEMCREGMPHDRQAEYAVAIQDEGGREVYRAALRFEGTPAADLDAGLGAASDPDAVA